MENAYQRVNRAAELVIGSDARIRNSLYKPNTPELYAGRLTLHAEALNLVGCCI
jgi:hypothetical protein